MREEDVEWVRDAFASGRVKILRLVTDHSVHDCGNAAGITGGGWWRLENGESITPYRAETVYPVLRRLQNGERLDAETDAETVTTPAAVEDEATKQVRHEVALLIAADSLMSLSPSELVKAALTWNSAMVRETRSVARRVLRRRILDLGGEPPAEEPR
ncbi:MAG: hypothetical protein JXA87_04120 [Thermoleophilia bacterium]|nr:hypothetical protein [Thermoleophilia bacterium]